jgi:hypothetical protein
VYQLPPQKVAAAERVGGLYRYSNTCACSSSGNVDSLRANPGERAIDRQHGRLVRTSLVDPG